MTKDQIEHARVTTSALRMAERIIRQIDKENGRHSATWRLTQASLKCGPSGHHLLLGLQEIRDAEE